jgi:hypothetical protein
MWQSISTVNAVTVRLWKRSTVFSSAPDTIRNNNRKSIMFRICYFRIKLVHFKLQIHFTITRLLSFNPDMFCSKRKHILTNACNGTLHFVIKNTRILLRSNNLPSMIYNVLKRLNSAKNVRYRERSIRS